MRPGKGQPNDGDGPEHGGDEMAEREPPAGQHKPDDVAYYPERAGADIFLAGQLVTANSPRAEWEQRINGDVEGGARPGQADDGDGHDDGGHEPAKGHPGAAEQDPDDVEEDGHRLHVITRLRVMTMILSGSACEGECAQRAPSRIMPSAATTDALSCRPAWRYRRAWCLPR